MRDRTYKAPPEPRPVTKQEHKALMRQFFTVRRDIVKQCGHKIDLDSAPRTNCEACWFAWFSNNGELVKSLDEMFGRFGPVTIVQMRGVKFYHMWRKFMATMSTMLGTGKKEKALQ